MLTSRGLEVVKERYCYESDLMKLPGLADENDLAPLGARAGTDSLEGGLRVEKRLLPPRAAGAFPVAAIITSFPDFKISFIALAWSRSIFLFRE